MKKLLSVICLILCVSVFFAACNNTDDKNIEITTESGFLNISEFGEGETSFQFEVHSKDGTIKKLTVKTNKETVGEALAENDLIDGEPGPYGLYVKSVLGVSGDYNTDGAYWAFYINGEYGSTGVDQTPIDETAVYSFRYETF